MINRNYTLKTVVVGDLEVNCYLLSDAVSKKTLIIDPGADAKNIEKVIAADSLIPVAVLDTHGHTDHIGANEYFKLKYKIPLYIHKNDSEFLADPFLNCSVYLPVQVVSPAADVLLKEGDTLSVGGLKMSFVHTPGHTPGSMCAVCEDLVFTGDTLFNGTAGRTDLNAGSEADIIKSLAKLKKLSPNLKVFPGHGPASTIGEELKTNPFMR